MSNKHPSYAGSTWLPVDVDSGYVGSDWPDSICTQRGTGHSQSSQHCPWERSKDKQNFMCIYDIHIITFNIISKCV